MQDRYNRSNPVMYDPYNISLLALIITKYGSNPYNNVNVIYYLVFLTMYSCNILLLDIIIELLFVFSIGISKFN